MPMLRAIRTLNAIEAGTLSSSGLQSLIAGDATRGDELSVLFNQYGQVQRIVCNSSALVVIFGSALATALFISSSVAMKSLFNSVAGKMALYNSDTALNALAANANAMALARISSNYSVVSLTENGTTAVTISALTGVNYICLGISRNAATIRTATLTTLRTGSGIGATATSLAVSTTTALDVNVAIPIKGPFTSTLNGTGTGLQYLGVLRCDI